MTCCAIRGATALRTLPTKCAGRALFDEDATPCAPSVLSATRTLAQRRSGRSLPRAAPFPAPRPPIPSAGGGDPDGPRTLPTPRISSSAGRSRSSQRCQRLPGREGFVWLARSCGFGGDPAVGAGWSAEASSWKHNVARLLGQTGHSHARVLAARDGRHLSLLPRLPQVQDRWRAGIPNRQQPSAAISLHFWVPGGTNWRT